MPSVPLPNFSKGEISPDLYGRIDTPQYSSALKTCNNFVVLKYGGVTFRPGTRLVGTTDDPEAASRLIPFRFSFDQSYALLFMHGIMRPIANGGFVVEQDTQITDINPLGLTTILTIPFHGYEVGDRLYLAGITGMTELNGRIVTVVGSTDADHIEIDVDSRDFENFISSDGTLNVGAPPAPPTPPVIPPVVLPPDPPPTTPQGGYDYEWRYGYYPPWYIPPEY
jgi:hypothetical protein